MDARSPIPSAPSDHDKRSAAHPHVVGAPFRMPDGPVTGALGVMNTDPRDPTPEHILESFFTAKSRDEGTGRGLSVVHGTVQSDPGEGTAFNVSLPHLTADGPASDGPDPDEHPQGRADEDSAPHVLVVDDEKAVRDIEAIRLQRLGYEVTTCSGGTEALRVATEAPDAFDLVITDYVMPDGDGLELVRSLRQQGHSIPVVLMSGFTARISEDQVHDAGVDHFLQKPVDTDELMALLEQIFGASSAPDS